MLGLLGTAIIFDRLPRGDEEPVSIPISGAGDIRTNIRTHSLLCDQRISRILQRRHVFTPRKILLLGLLCFCELYLDRHPRLASAAKLQENSPSFPSTGSHGAVAKGWSEE